MNNPFLKLAPVEGKPLPLKSTLGYRIRDEGPDLSVERQPSLLALNANNNGAECKFLKLTPDTKAETGCVDSKVQAAASSNAGGDKAADKDKEK